jgi:hypothetical protein
MTGVPCLNGDHSYGFASSMGHPRLNLVGQLVYDDMRTYPGTDVVLQVSHDSANPVETDHILTALST